jgi:hypothetical protein
MVQIGPAKLPPFQHMERIKTFPYVLFRIGDALSGLRSKKTFFFCWQLALVGYKLINHTDIALEFALVINRDPPLFR